MATSQTEPQTEFSSCIRKGRRNACAEIKYSTSETSENQAEGATKPENLTESCSVDHEADNGSLSSHKNSQ